ncbi:MAG: hypothetical protein IPF53_18040 [Blastocatellia bacterium]|nr:hypothetical protein [Blastocatellia bacterium]
MAISPLPFSEARYRVEPVANDEDAAFLLALAGFGIKAGLVPLHAYFRSPTGRPEPHQRALMSGVAIKIATSGFFLLGSAAISALPPLNGFASEWLVFQSLLSGFEVESLVVTIAIPVAVGMLALTGGLAAACFVKAFGITFLGTARSTEAEHARVADVHAGGNGPARGSVPRARNRRAGRDADPWPDRRDGSRTCRSTRRLHPHCPSLRRQPRGRVSLRRSSPHGSS